MSVVVSVSTTTRVSLCMKTIAHVFGTRMQQSKIASLVKGGNLSWRKKHCLPYYHSILNRSKYDNEEHYAAREKHRKRLHNGVGSDNKPKAGEERLSARSFWTFRNTGCHPYHYYLSFRNTDRHPYHFYQSFRHLKDQ